jgi:hypothetical protein
MPLFEYPRNAAFGRVLPKNKIYAHARPAGATKELFIRQVEQIVWQYKLAPETINISGTPSVPEIQVFSIALRDGELKTEVLRCIDQAISFPIVFELAYDGKIKPVAAFKRPSDADAARRVASEYFDGGWAPANAPRRPLPMVFDLETLYDQLLTPLMPYPARPAEGLPARVERMERIRIKQREMERCRSRLRKEKQFNRKVEINAELRELKQEIDNLTRPFSASGTAVTP